MNEIHSKNVTSYNSLVLCNGNGFRFGNRFNFLLIMLDGIVSLLLPSVDVTERVTEDTRDENHRTRQVERSVIIVGCVVKHTC